ncbi:MAG: hypothetical protein ACRDJI_01910 [Actinomycetota bacterium]
MTVRRFVADAASTSWMALRIAVLLDVDDILYDGRSETVGRREGKGEVCRPTAKSSSVVS